MRPREPEFDVHRARWRKSTRSGTNGNCVEVGTVAPTVGIRDTKDQGRGPVLAFSRPVWEAFLDGCKSGEFDR